MNGYQIKKTKNNTYKLRINNKYIIYNKIHSSLLLANNKKDELLNQINEIKTMEYEDILSKGEIKFDIHNNCIIELKNNSKKVIDNAIIDKEYYFSINKHKWYKKDTGYACTTINKKNWTMHRYIYTFILKKDIDNKIIDHIDINKLNNKICNLRIVSHSFNNLNSIKRTNSISKYKGVSPSKKKWIATIIINKQLLYASYNNEIHAAHQYNIWVKTYNLNISTLNKIDESDIINFIEYNKKKKDKNLIYITQLKNKKYRVIVKKKHLGYFNNLQDAINLRDVYLKDLK